MKYEDVVSKAIEEINKRTNYRNNKVIYEPCTIWKAGNQINLWSYWQGYQLKDIGKERIDILLVGQDWGCPEKHPYECERIKKIQSGEDSDYISNSATDKHLAEMFSMFNTVEKDINIYKKAPGLRLFFTNY